MNHLLLAYLAGAATAGPILFVFGRALGHDAASNEARTWDWGRHERQEEPPV